jgi:four helix bundle protein
MKSYKDLRIYQIAFDLAIRTNKLSFQLPDYEQYEIERQMRKSSMSVKDNIVEGYGRKRYKSEFIRFLTISHASTDEISSQLESIKVLYPELADASKLLAEYYDLGKQICSFIKYVENNWK